MVECVFLHVGGLNPVQWMMLDDVLLCFQCRVSHFVISSEAYVDPLSTELNSIIIISVHTVDTTMVL